MMRLFTQHFLSPASSLASPGIDELRWPKPVRPGDVLSIRVTVTEARRSRSEPQQGIVHSFVEVLAESGSPLPSLLMRSATSFVTTKSSSIGPIPGSR